MINNPLIKPILNAELNEHKCVYVLLKKFNYKIDDSIYKLMIDKTTFETISDNLLIYKASKNLLNNNHHKNNALFLSAETLNKYNLFNYELEPYNIVIPIFNIEFDNIKIYLEQFENNNSLETLYKLLTINNYFNNINNITNIDIIEADYWTKDFNCSANLSLYFKNRNYYKTMILDKNINDYLSNLPYNKRYIINNKEFNFKITKDCIYTKNEINNLFDNLDEENKYFLFCNLLVSKQYSHLVLNNKYLLETLKPITTKYAHLFRYLIGYAWIRFYFEESIKKSYITKDDDFIFDIDTASALPIFPFILKYSKLNPYMTILVNDKLLYPEVNIGPLQSYKNISSGVICNLNEFKERLNIFTTGDINKNLFENINWTTNKMGLGGSAICACIQKNHPLMNLFLNFPINDRINRYFDEYYALSDIDIMFLTQNPFEFIDCVANVYEQININITKYYGTNHAKKEMHKIVYLFVSKNYIKKKFSNIYENILKTLDNENTIKLFNDEFVSEIQKYTNNISKNDDIKYSDIYDMSNLVYKIKITENENDTFNIKINLKYKIISPELKHPLELFMVKYNDFFATVQTFHLPCVRAYYDGNNVYMTPSCISAHLTYMNLDYKYFAGNHEPTEIIYKYRTRGFGTWLNFNEIDTYKEKTKDTILGVVPSNEKLFQPRLYNADEYYNIYPVDLETGYVYINDATITTVEDFFEETNLYYNIVSNSNIKFLKNLTTINENGSINPLEKWIIKTVYEIMKLKKL